MYQQLASELSDIFGQCQKNENGEVEVYTLVDVFMDRYGEASHLREYLVAKLDPNQVNEAITEETLIRLMKNIIDQEDESSLYMKSPELPPLPPECCSTPKTNGMDRHKLFKELSDEFNISTVNDSSQSSGMTSAIQKSMVANMKMKNQELLERLFKTEMTANSLELKLKNESATNLSIRKENIKLKEELKILQRLEESKLEDCSKIEKMEKLCEKKCHDLDKATKQIISLEEKITDLQNEKKDIMSELKSATRRVNDQMNSIQALNRDIGQVKRDYDQLEKEYELQASKLISLELDRQTLVNRISQISSEKQDLTMKVAEMSICQTIPCLNYSGDTSCELVMSVPEINYWDNINSLQQEMGLNEVSLACRSPDSSSDNQHSDPCEVAHNFHTTADGEQPKPVWIIELRAREGSPRSECPLEQLPLLAVVQTQTSFLSPSVAEKDTQTEFDLTQYMTPLGGNPALNWFTWSNNGLTEMSDLNSSVFPQCSDGGTNHELCVLRSLPLSENLYSINQDWPNRRYLKAILVSVVMSMLCLLTAAVVMELSWAPTSHSTNCIVSQWINSDMFWSGYRHYNGPPPT